MNTCQHCSKELRPFEVFGDPGEVLCFKCNAYLHGPRKLLRVDSIVIECASCGRWIDRYAAWEGDEFWYECPRCGSTTMKSRAGRPYGPKSRQWHEIEKAFRDIENDFFETWLVKTDPAMPEPNFDFVKVSLVIGGAS